MAVRQAWLPPKVLLVMKLTAFLIMIVLVQASAKSYSQITLNEKHAPLEKVLKQIKKQTGYTFFYDINDVNGKQVSVQVADASLDQVLSICFRDIPLTFKVVQNNIVLKKKDESILGRMMNLVSLAVNVSGVITDENGPLQGVSVTVKDRNLATTTDEKGNFSINGLKEDDIILFTFVGYKTQEVIVKNIRYFKIRMEKDITGLDQVVVVAYGTSKKKDLTGSVSSVNGKDIQDVPFNTIDNALAGKAAGVQVTKTDGSPGGAVRIRIRGSSSLLGGNDPLYVIDGVPVQVQSNYQDPGYGLRSPIGDNINSAVAGGLSNAGLSTAFVNGLNSLGGLNVDDIESITILKDASSTAIYGSKAANGVVIITTKKGKKDMTPQITANYSTIVSSAITPHLLNGQQFKDLFTESVQNEYSGLKAAGDQIPALVNAVLNNPSSFFGNKNTDWIKEVTRTPVAYNGEVSVQGGSSKSKYFSSISYNSTPGVVDATSLQKISGKINLESEIREHFKFVTNIILGYTNQNLGDGAYDQAIRARPDFGPYDAAGNFTDFSPVGSPSQGFMNPVAMLSATNNARTFNLIGSASGIYDFSKSLQFKSTVSLNMQTYNQRIYTPSYLTVGSLAVNTGGGGIGSNSNTRSADWFVENTLGYNKTFNEKHSIDVLIGTSYETNKTSFFTATATGYPNDNVLNSLSSAITPIFVKGDDPTHPQSYLLSFYARANYGYMDKYLFTFTGRTDGSSKFGTDNKFGYFPSGAVAWRISKENFLKNVTWINDIKLRGSYGLTGNQNIGDQMYRTLYSPYSYAGQNALIPTQLGNQTIRWESTREADAGLDISLFNDRLTVTADYYNKQTSGALLSLPVAPSSSYGALLSNAVGIKNTGVELSIQGDIIRTKDFKWDASVNVTWNNSLVTKLSSDADLTQIGDLTGLEIGNTALIQGKPLGLITGATVRGIIKTQADLDAYKKRLGIYADIYYPYLGIGDPIYALNHENSTSGSLPNYNTIIASAAPKYFGGFSQGFTYKKFELQFYFTFSQGGKLVWGDHIGSTEFAGVTNANTSILDRYNPQNTNAIEPRLSQLTQYYKSNLDVFSSSYLKLRTLTLNYHLDKSAWMDKAGLHSLGLFASATNVFTITKYPGLDPETSDDPYSVAGGYFDASNYPAIRAFTIGLRASF